VFLFRECLGREAGDLSGFQTSRRGPQMPSVLSRKECQQLFEAMGGTPRLMAELYTHVMNRPGLGIRSPLDAREVES